MKGRRNRRKAAPSSTSDHPNGQSHTSSTATNNDHYSYQYSTNTTNQYSSNVSLHTASQSHNSGSHGGNHNSSNNGNECNTIAALLQFDKCHNDGVPCCNALRDIVANIFPDLISSSSSSSSSSLSLSATSCSQNGFGMGLDASIGTNANAHVPQNHQGTSGNGNGNTPSLLSLLIRKYLLENRKKRLGGDLSRILNASTNDCNRTNRGNGNTGADGRNDNGNGNNGMDSQMQGTVAASASSSGSKKKRKKKKKKKGNSSSTGACASISADASSCDIGGQAEIQSQSQDSSDPLSLQESTSASLSLSRSESQCQSQSDACTQIKPSASGSASGSGKNKNKNRNKNRNRCNDKMDELLDRLLIQYAKNASTSTPKTHSKGGENTETKDLIPLPQNRDLSSLLSHIQTKLQNSSKNHNNNNKQPSRRGNKSKNHKNTSNNNKDINTMPNIPMMEINGAIEKITCRYCQSACLESIRMLCSGAGRIGTNNIGGNVGGCLEVGWGGYGHVTDADALEEGGAIGSSISGGKDEVDDGMRIIKSIQLDGSTVEVNSDRDVAQFRDIERSRFGCVSGFLMKSGSVRVDDDENVYHLMEEGGGGEVSTFDDKIDGNGPYLEQRRGLGQRHGIRMEVVQKKGISSKYFRLGQTDYSTFTIESFDRWINDVIIPCGMKEVAEMTEEDAKTVAEETEKHASRLSGILTRELPGVLQQARCAIDEATESMQGSVALNNVAFKKLKECSEFQEVYMDILRELLRKLDVLTLHMRASKHEHQKWVCNLIDGLWDTYMEKSKALVSPSLNWIWQGIQLDKNRTGSVPQFFRSPVRCEYLKNMLEVRYGILVDLLNTFETKLQPGNEANACCPLRQLAAFGQYFALHETAMGNVEEILEAIEEMLIVRDELVCSTIYHCDVGKIHKIQSDRCTKVFERASHVYELLNERVKSANLRQKDTFTWDANNINIEDHMMMYDNHKEEPEQSLKRNLDEFQRLCNYVKHVIEQCRFYCIIEASNFMKEVEDNDKIPSQVLRISKGIYDKCQGNYGMRRITGILSAYLYNWLQEQCMEWHADLTHQELMIETEEELLQESKDNGANEQKKKSKKKKKKKGSSKKGAQAAEGKPPRETTKESETERYLEEKKIESIARYETGLDEVSIDSLKESIEEVNVYPSEGPTATPTESSGAMRSSSSSIEEESSVKLLHDESADEKANEETMVAEKEQIRVCVMDRGKKISAESFLCARYFQALKDCNMKQ